MRPRGLALLLLAPGLGAAPARGPAPPAPPVAEPTKAPEGSALVELSRVRLAQGDRAGALEAGRRAFELVRRGEDPRAVPALLQLGEVFTALEETDLAAKAYDLAQARSPAGAARAPILLARARLEARGLIDPDGFEETVVAYLRQDPLTLDEDAVIYLLGFAKGLRLGRSEEALAALARVWAEAPRSEEAARARLTAALVEGLALGREAGALARLAELEREHPHSSLLGLGALARAVLALARGDAPAALEGLANLAPQDPKSRHGALLAAFIHAYRLDQPEKAEAYLSRLAATPGKFSRLARYHQALLALSARADLAAAMKALDGLEADDDLPASWIESLRASVERIADADDVGERRYRLARFFDRHGHYPRARREYLALAGDEPDSATGDKARLRLEALEQDDRGRLDGSLAGLEALARDGKLGVAQRAEARWRLARARLAQGATPSEAFPPTAPGDRDPFRAPAMRGLLLHAPGTDPERVRLLERMADELDPADPERRKVLAALGGSLAQEKQTRAALDIYQELVADDPSAAREVDRLMDELRIEALTPGGKDPGDAAARVRLALLELRRGRPERTESLLEGVRKDSSSDPVVAARATAYLARLLHARRARPERVREVIESALGKDVLPERDRLAVLEIKAERVAAEDPQEARGLRRILVRAGYRVRDLLPALVEDEAARRGPLGALSLLRHLVGDLQPDSRLTALVAGLYEEAEDLDRARDARTRLVETWPTAPEAPAARLWLAGEEAKRLAAALAAQNLPAAYKHRVAAEFLEATDGEGRRAHRLLLDQVVEPGPTELPAELLLAMGRAYLLDLRDPAKAASLFRRAEAAGLPEAGLGRAAAEEAQGNERAALATLAALGDDPAAPRARALAEAARLQRDHFGDLEAAGRLWRRALEAGSPDDPQALAVALALLDGMAKTGASAAARLQTLDELLPRVGGRPARAELARRRGDLLAQLGRREDAAGAWLSAARDLESAEQAVEVARRGLEELIAIGRFARAETEASAFLKERAGLEGIEEIRALLRRASARGTVATLVGAINWQDPESRANLDRLWRAAQLLVTPLQEYGEAAARLQTLLQLFPGSPEAGEARVLLGRLPDLERAAGSTAPAAEGVRHDRARPEERLAAARFLEYRLRDEARAAEAYAKLVEEKDGVVGLLAGMALMRILAQQPGQEAAAWRLAEDLLARPVPPALQGRLRGRLALLQDRGSWRNLEAELRAAPEAGRDPVLARMAEHAARSYQDSVLAVSALDRIKDPGLHARTALAVARALDPASALAPEAPGRSDLFDRAVAKAISDVDKGEARLARGIHREDVGDREGAMADYQKVAAIPGARAPDREEALYRRARLLLADGEDPTGALAALETIVAQHPGGERYLLASSKAPEVLDRIRAEEADRRAMREGNRDPQIYLETARALADQLKALPQALENYRTYIRVGPKPELVAQAYRESAEVLVRMQKPLEAILTLQQLLGRADLKVDPAPPTLRIGEIQELELADHEAARTSYQRVLDRFAGSASAKRASQGLARIKGLADDAAQKSELGDAHAADVLGAIREEYLKGKRPDTQAAVEALRAAIDRATSTAERRALYLELASLEDTKRKKPREAAEAYEGYLASDPPHQKKTADVLLRLADLYRESLARPERAHELFGRYLKDYPTHSGRVAAMLRDAASLEAIDRVQEAIQVYQNVIDSYPRSGHDEIALDRLANLKRTYFAAFQEAIDAYRELVARFPFSNLADDAQYNMARIFEIELGNLNQARIEYETLLRRYPSSEHYLHAQQGLARIQRR